MSIVRCIENRWLEISKISRFHLGFLAIKWIKKLKVHLSERKTNEKENGSDFSYNALL